MKAHIYKMTCLTNLHVGNGDVNYNIIDNEVERDPVLNEPVIPSSGVKGALLAFVNDSRMNEQTRVEIFGNQDSGGTYKFLSAGLLARPVRVTAGDGAYVLATSKELLNTYKNLCYQLKDKRELVIPEKSGITSGKAKEVEGCKVEPCNSVDLRTLFGDEPWAVLSAEELRNIALPVTARNKLGENKNLWYEEFVPHKSIFYLIILTPGEDNMLDGYINGEVVQFGADASIGYGLVKIEKM